MTETEETKNLEHFEPGALTYIIFLITFFVVLVSVIPVVFPALVLVSQGGFVNYFNINPYELGAFAYPFLAINFGLLAFGILYRKKLLPRKILNSIKFLFNFEVSKKIAFFTIIALLAIFTVLNASHIPDPVPDFDWVRLKQTVLDSYGITFIKQNPTQPHVMYVLLIAGLKIFGYPRLVPFIASIALAVLTYIVTADIAKKRFAGLISMPIVLQSGIFLVYQNVPEYPNFWILFYLVSIYVINKKWYLSPVSFLASIFSKNLAGIFFPFTLFFIYRTHMPPKQKMLVGMTYLILGGIFVVAIIAAPKVVIGTPLRFDQHNFWSGFTSFTTEARFDLPILFLLLPLVVGLLVAARKGVAHADSIMVFFTMLIIESAFLSASTGQQNQPYRFISMIVFFAIGIGILFSRRSTLSSSHHGP